MSALSARPFARRRAVGLVVAGSLAASALATILGASPASAYSVYTSSDGVGWTVNDARRSALDTGSLRAVTNSRAEGMGSLFLHVDESSAPRMNDQMMRGFGLEPSGNGSYLSTRSVRLGNITVTRKLDLATTADTASFFDTFTNTSTEPETIEVSFGGSLGYGDPADLASGGGAATAATVSASSDGNTTIDTDDTWATATYQGASYRPTGVVLGSTGSSHLGNQQLDPFTSTYSTTGSASNNPGFVQTLTIQPGATSSLLHYVVVGAQGDTSTISTTTAALATAPKVGNLSVDELCTVANWDRTSLGLSDAICSGAEPLRLPAAPLDPATGATTTVGYDVTGKTIQQLQADLSAGKVTSVQLTKAYLDRIQAYDQGQLGFHAFITVAKTAIAQAMAADQARAAGKTGDLLGIPIAVKDLYNTKDMPTTGGTRALEDWQPATDAWQVADLRKAGAVIIGKTNLSEFANSGSWSESGFEQTWNALYPSKSSFGSSGGSAVAVATDMAAAAMGTQTGVSLYAPSTGSSVYAFRGTDGLSSTDGVMPLTWGQDYAGPIAKSIPDLASLLDATATQTTGNDPDDILTSRVDNAKRPTEWKTALNADALKGKVIGYLPSSFQSTKIADDTTGAIALAHATAAIEAAGGTLVPITTPVPAQPPLLDANGNPYTITSGAGSSTEGWWKYIDENQGFPFATPGDLKSSPANLPYNVSRPSTSVPMTDTDITNYLARRDAYKAAYDSWMSSAGVSAVIYPGFLTGVGNNDESSDIFSSDRGTNVPTSNVGLPTVIMPIGVNANGQSDNLQIVGPSWSDAQVLGYGYAVDQQSHARLHTTFAPALAFAGAAASTTGLSLASTAITYGSTTSATVTVASDAKPTGTVTVQVAGKTVTGTLAGGKATVAVPAGIGVGTYVVTATYAGSTEVAASTATATLTVRYARPSVTVKLAKKKVRVGHRARLTVGISSTGAVAGTHTVLVYDGKRILTSATLDSAHGSVKLPRLAKGKHRIKVYVAGDASYAPATSRAVVLKVVR
ncbi:amidase family protein [Nocardioides sp. BP30]|uniref:amidase family protein n=1 Tax=Nocardioides sp. BP30 TaxID=3036374 RepID=UPI002468E72A|nr:amidase family protein [Nocardioides sp. BP30]WGL51814.1 amidase family protein [Nocardioides sp. BP30]